MAHDLVLYSHPMSRGRIARSMPEEAGRHSHDVPPPPETHLGVGR